jgi:hypothetical protein
MKQGSDLKNLNAPPMRSTTIYPYEFMDSHGRWLLTPFFGKTQSKRDKEKQLMKNRV